MKASELRIGNWVNVVNSPIENEIGIYRINGTGIYHASTEGANINIEGVPLTEGWLLKLGFDKVNLGNKNKFSKEINGSNTELIIYIDEDGEIDCEIDVGESWHYLPKKEYVHQLQNLYFALTGEELELKKE